MIIKNKFGKFSTNPRFWLTIFEMNQSIQVGQAVSKQKQEQDEDMAFGSSSPV